MPSSLPRQPHQLAWENPSLFCADSDRPPAGSSTCREETHCSFCNQQLRDWRLAFLDLPLALPVMTVRRAHRA